MASCSNVGTHCRIEVAATVSDIFSFLLLMGTSKTEKGGDVSICNVMLAFAMSLLQYGNYSAIK